MENFTNSDLAVLASDAEAMKGQYQDRLADGAEDDEEKAWLTGRIALYAKAQEAFRAEISRRWNNS